LAWTSQFPFPHIGPSGLPLVYDTRLTGVHFRAQLVLTSLRPIFSLCLCLGVFVVYGLPSHSCFFVFLVSTILSFLFFLCVFFCLLLTLFFASLTPVSILVFVCVMPPPPFYSFARLFLCVFFSRSSRLLIGTCVLPAVLSAYFNLECRLVPACLVFLTLDWCGYAH